MKLKSLVVAVAMGVAAASANAAIQNGGTGNGELFFNIWDSNGSYTFDLNKTIDAFQADVAAPGAIKQEYTLTNFASFMSTVADPSLLKFNVVAVDTSSVATATSPFGNTRYLTTFSGNVPAAVADNTNRTVMSNVSAFADKVNTVIGTGGDSVAVASSSDAWAGKATFKDNPGGIQGFSNGGTLANNTYEFGMNFMRIDVKSTGTAKSVYTQFNDGVVPVRLWLDNTDQLHIAAAVPEPESYAMLLAGLGMIGFMARRRLNNRI